MSFTRTAITIIPVSDEFFASADNPELHLEQVARREFARLAPTGTVVKLERLSNVPGRKVFENRPDLRGKLDHIVGVRYKAEIVTP